MQTDKFYNQPQFQLILQYLHDFSKTFSCKVTSGPITQKGPILAVLAILAFGSMTALVNIGHQSSLIIAEKSACATRLSFYFCLARKRHTDPRC